MDTENITIRKKTIRGRNGFIGWLSYRVLPSIGSCIGTFLLGSLASIPIYAIAFIFMSFAAKQSWIKAENMEDFTQNEWVVSLTLMGTMLFIIWRCYKKYHIHIRFSKAFLLSKKTIILSSIAIGIIQFFPISILEEYLNLPNREDFSDMTHNPIGILTMCLIGPIAEEMLVRGVVLRKMMRWNINSWYPIIISSLLFGFIHINPAQIPGAILGGILMAWITYRTKSLIPAIIIHIVNNSLCLFAQNILFTQY